MDFFLLLGDSGDEIGNSILNYDILKYYLTEHGFYKESKIIENCQQAKDNQQTWINAIGQVFQNDLRYAKDKQQSLIDITPQQTLSIETSAADE